jgi:ABC-type sulfate/molybdate transport systems ATPase subunit
MNGLDPAGMQEMRDMIRSLVAEGRTAVLSSHLLDEVERTCDAVAILPCSVRLSDDQDRTVDRTRDRHRLPRRPRPRLVRSTIGVNTISRTIIKITPTVRCPSSNLQRAVVGVATAHLEPSQLPLAFGGSGHDYRLTESTTTAVCVILAWIIGWTALGAWRMATRDA